MDNHLDIKVYVHGKERVLNNMKTAELRALKDIVNITIERNVLNEDIKRAEKVLLDKVTENV